MGTLNCIHSKRYPGADNEGVKMSTLGWISSAALLLHIVAIIGLLLLLLLQIGKSPRQIHLGVMHSALLALVAGLVMVGVRPSLHNESGDKWPLLNNGLVGIKFLVLLVILTIGYRNFKKPIVKNFAWIAMIALTVFNIMIALLF